MDRVCGRWCMRSDLIPLFMDLFSFILRRARGERNNNKSNNGEMMGDRTRWILGGEEPVITYLYRERERSVAARAMNV